MLENLFNGQITPDRAMHWSKVLWTILAVLWLLLAFTIKKAKRSESLLERAQHLIPLLIGFWLLFGQTRMFSWLHLRLLPSGPALWLTGVLVTAVGLGMSIWARLSLGTNWSGTVTLKDGHELIRKGLYRRIRHPLYTGLLVAVIGTGLIHGQLRDLLSILTLYGTFYFKAKREESFLQQEFGPNFTEHQRHTGMFWPKLI